MKTRENPNYDRANDHVRDHAIEMNLDGLIGPTHHYAGLSFGNIASMQHAACVSNPREAALQGLRKMQYLSNLGLAQGLLPPHERPDIQTLRQLGFGGSDATVVRTAARCHPEIFRSCCSASSMWSANAATVAASRDCSDQKVHFTAANLVSKFHRSIEHLQTSRVLSKIFENPKYFVHHPALPSHLDFGDEGAANHTRFCTDYGSKGLHFFVYGRVAYQGQKTPNLFPARQTLEASQAVARLHQLDPEAIVFAQQNPEAIDAGVFHNDVVAVGNSSVLFCHEAAFLSQASVLEELKEKFKKMTGGKQLQIIQVAASQVSLQDAIDSYLFNTQLIEVPGKSKMLLIAPQECNEVVSVRQYLEDLLGSANCPIGEVQKFDLRQSMQNGGGPACLRLRVVLTDEELKNTHSKIMMNDSLFEELSPWVIKHYRDRLSLEDLADTQLMNENRTALDELTQILDLGSIYGFQTAV